MNIRYSKDHNHIYINEVTFPTLVKNHYDIYIKVNEKDYELNDHLRIQLGDMENLKKDFEIHCRKALVGKLIK